VVFMQVRYRLTCHSVKRYTRGTMTSISDWKTARIEGAGHAAKVRSVSVPGRQAR
jgi:hypothetical protein